jgi:hypothetical protein
MQDYILCHILGQAFYLLNTFLEYYSGFSDLRVTAGSLHLILQDGSWVARMTLLFQ